MRSTGSFFWTICVFFAAVLLQWLWSAHFAIDGMAPQILLVLTVVLASRRGAVSAMAMGFFWGLFLDSMGARFFGANALALTVLAYLAGAVRHQMDAGETIPQAALAVVATWVYFLILAVISWVFGQKVLWAGWASVIILPFYNGLLAAGAVAFMPWRKGA